MGDCGPGIQNSGEEEAGSPGEEKEDTQREKRSRRARRGASWKKRKNIWRFWLGKHPCLNSPETTNHEAWGVQVRGNPGSLEQQRIKEMEEGNFGVGRWVDGRTEGQADRQADS